MNVLEPGFAALAVVVLVGSLIGGVVADDGSAADRTVDFRPDVPDVDAFEATDEPGVAVVDGTSYDSVQAAVDAAEPGDTVTLEGQFDERVTVRTPGITITSGDGYAVLDGGGDVERSADGGTDGTDAGGAASGVGDPVGSEGTGASDATVLVIEADDVTVDGIWVRNSGFSATEQDAGIWVNGTATTVVDSRITDITFGIWVDDVDDVVLRNNTIVGHEDVYPLAERGNGVQLFDTAGTVVEDNDITRVRDGIYFSWASEVVGRNNTMWNLRFGVHYMYSDNCRLEGNVAFDNDVGFALMVSNDLELVENVAVNNRGPSGHGILILHIEDTTLRGNEVVGNKKGFHMDNSQRITIVENLIMENDLGIHVTSGSRDETVHDNSFVHNDRQVFTPMNEQKYWDGNYWSDANKADLTNDGTSEIRHRPEGMVENLVYREPEAAVFANSPAFDAVRLAESSFPVIESPGVVDTRPNVGSDNDWRRYYEN